MKSEILKCKNCRRVIRNPNPRIKNQEYCGEKKCQRARKRKWQRRKMSSDQDYRLNQEAALAKWRGIPGTPYLIIGKFHYILFHKAWHERRER